MEVLRGKGPEDLIHESITLAANMLYLGGKGTYEDCVTLAEDTLKSGRGFEKFVEMVKAQGGDASVLTDATFAEAAYKKAVIAPKSGYITHMDAEACGRAALALGAGRYTKTDTLDYKAGIWMLKKTGDAVEAGDTIAYLQSSSENTLVEGETGYLNALTIKAAPPAKRPLVFARVTADGTERYV